MNHIFSKEPQIIYYYFMIAEFALKESVYFSCLEYSEQ